MTNHYKIISIFEPDEIIPLISGNWRKRKKIRLYDWDVNINSLKLNCFKKYGMACVQCGIEAKNFYLVEENRGHENVISLQSFGFTDDGKRILMTIDHIIPVSKDGPKKSISNVQPMCSICNKEKGNNLDAD